MGFGLHEAVCGTMKMRSAMSDKPFQSPPFSPPSNLRHLLCQGFLLRQGFGGQDGGQEGYDRQAGPTQWLFQESAAESKFLATSSSAEAEVCS